LSDLVEELDCPDPVVIDRPAQAHTRIACSLGLAGTTTIKRAGLSRTGFVRRLLAECRRHDVAVLNGSVGLAKLYDEPLVAALLARRGLPVLLAECIWEPGSRTLGHLLGGRTTPAVDLVPRRTARASRAAIGELDHRRLHYAVFSTHEQRRFAETWGVDPSRVHFTPYWATTAGARPLDGGPAVFAGGDSLRDYRPLLAAAPRVDGEVFVATRLPMPGSLPANVTARTLTPERYATLARGASVHVVSLIADSARSAGQQTYLNAMALGRPVVVTDAPGVRDYIDHGVTGFVVSGEDPEGLADTVNMLLADTATAERVGAAAKRMVESRFTIGHYTERLCRLATSIAASPLG
jgi:hypothetical protein